MQLTGKGSAICILICLIMNPDTARIEHFEFLRDVMIRMVRSSCISYFFPLTFDLHLSVLVSSYPTYFLKMSIFTLFRQYRTFADRETGEKTLEPNPACVYKGIWGIKLWDVWKTIKMQDLKFIAAGRRSHTEISVIFRLLMKIINSFGSVI